MNVCPLAFALGGGAICEADVRGLNNIQVVVPRCDVAEVGDGGDVVRVDSNVGGLLLDAFVDVHIHTETIAHIRADAGDERRHVRGGVRIARGDDGGRALELLVVVEVEQVGGRKSALGALGIVCLPSDCTQVVVGFLCCFQACIRLGKFRS